MEQPASPLSKSTRFSDAADKLAPPPWLLQKPLEVANCALPRYWKTVFGSGPARIFWKRGLLRNGSHSHRKRRSASVMLLGKSEHWIGPGVESRRSIIVMAWSASPTTVHQSRRRRRRRPPAAPPRKPPSESAPCAHVPRRKRVPICSTPGNRRWPSLATPRFKSRRVLSPRQSVDLSPTARGHSVSDA
jgi:hypothetical protein